MTVGGTVRILKRVLLIDSGAPAIEEEEHIFGSSTLETVHVRGLSQAARALQESEFHAIGFAQDVSDPELTWFESELERTTHVQPLLCLVRAELRQLADRLRARNVSLKSVKNLTPEALAAALGTPGSAPSGNAAEENDWARTLIGGSLALRRVREIIRLVAKRNCTVLISGESGTGKEMVARALHLASSRAGRPMVSVNCAAVPSTLLESEMFGHEKGSFTGAISKRIGRFEEAHKSTIFLDEIGDMPLELQAKILRVLQEREVQRVGGSEVSKVDVRVLAATNRDLGAEMKAGRFRHDLFFRLRVVPLHIPPLREHPEDIPALVEHFLEQTCQREGLPRKVMQQDVVSHLSEQPWPGNVRELEHAIERAVALSGDRETLDLCDFPPFCDLVPLETPSQSLAEFSEDGIDLSQIIGKLEQAIIKQALLKSKGNQARAAQLLHLKRSTLVSKVKAFSDCALSRA